MSSNREELIEAARAAIKPSDSIELVRAFEHLAADQASTAPVTLADEHDAAREEAKVQFPGSVSAQAAFMAGWSIRAVRGPAQTQPPNEQPTTADEREVLIALKLASHPLRMSDGYNSVVVRTNEEAAEVVIAAGFRRVAPAVEVDVKEGGQ